MLVSSCDESNKGSGKAVISKKSERNVERFQSRILP